MPWTYVNVKHFTLCGGVGGEQVFKNSLYFLWLTVRAHERTRERVSRSVI